MCRPVAFSLLVGLVTTASPARDIATPEPAVSDSAAPLTLFRQPHFSLRASRSKTGSV